MIKEEWIKVREEPHIPLGVWFSYYRERDGEIDDPVEFERIFNQVITQCPIFYDPTRGVIVRITAETARRRLFEYYDSTFDL